ncbi:MAG: MarR family transcriptional regulator [Naasia sp.]|nr:MarR family transcriptional regulator [Naasia sp.]
MTEAVDAWESLFRAQVAVMRRLVAEFPPGVSFTEYDVLFNLSRRPDRQARQRDLTGLVLLTQPSVSRLVDRLAARGLLEKLPDPSDRRGTVVRLTDAGYRAFAAVAAQHVRSIEAVMTAGLDPEELRALRTLADRLRAGIADAAGGG